MISDWVVTIIIILNVVIVLGYLFIATQIAPKLGINRLITLIGGSAFFFLCAATHTEEALHTYTESGYWTPQHAAVMLAITFLQAIAIWVFIVGLYTEFVGSKLPLRRKDRGHKDS